MCTPTPLDTPAPLLGDIVAGAHHFSVLIDWQPSLRNVCACSTLGSCAGASLQLEDNSRKDAFNTWLHVPSPCFLPGTVSNQFVHIHAVWSVRAGLIYIQNGDLGGI